MHEPGFDSVITPDLVRELREIARRGTTVRELTQVIQDRVGCRNDAVIPILAGFVHAFKLPLIKVLPIREWLGTDKDDEINGLILQEIENSRPEWLQPVVEAAGAPK